MEVDVQSVPEAVVAVVVVVAVAAAAATKASAETVVKVVKADRPGRWLKPAASWPVLASSIVHTGS